LLASPTVDAHIWIPLGIEAEIRPWRVFPQRSHIISIYGILILDFSSVYFWWRSSTRATGIDPEGEGVLEAQIT